MALTKVDLANTVEGTLPVANGGTGATTQAGAAAAVLPSQTGNTGKYLTTDGTDTSWGTVTSNPGTVTSVDTGTGLTGGPITSSGTITLANTAVTAGSYTTANITVDAQGRITAASSGTSGVSSVSGTAPIVSSGGATPAISITQATTSTNGYLSSTDWNTFNNKTSNTGTVTSVNLTAGTAISVSGGPITGSGSITVNNTGVTSLTAGTGISVSASTGGVTITNTAPASTTAGGIGTYALLFDQNTSGTTSFGGTISGANLIPACLSLNRSVYAASRVWFTGSVSGTWQCMGYAYYEADATRKGTTLWVRIS